MNLPKKEKYYSEKEAFTKILAFCSYQERNHREVREKLVGYGLKNSIIEEILSKLIQENFINEERFAKQYAGGKFRIKNWGRRKIIKALEQKGISEYCIKQGIKEISEVDYRETLKKLIKKQDKKMAAENEYKRKYKIVQYLVGRGYETNLIWEELNRKQ